MMYLMIRHKVASYERWKTAFDENVPPRKGNGFSREQLLRSHEDPNDLYLLLEVNDAEKVRRFVQSEDFTRQMRLSGVVGQPEIHFMEEVENRPCGAEAVQKVVLP